MSSITQPDSMGTRSNSYQFRFQQEDLALLCADRELRTHERHAVNDVYGQASILKRYARLPQRFRLRGIVEHGVFISGMMMDYDRHAWLPMAFSPSPQRAAFVERECGKRAVPIGFSYLYAKRLYHRRWGHQLTGASRRGTIVFPVHSTPKSAIQFDQQEYARRLSDLPDQFQPVVACIYWKDYGHGHHEPYLKHGIRVVTAGHMYDPDFLLRFYDTCRQFRYSASNFIGTNLFLSVAAGCRFFYLDSGPIDHNFHEDEVKDTSLADSEFRNIYRQSRELFQDPVEEITERQQQFVDRHLGAQYIRQPLSLASLFIEAILRDWFWPARTSASSPWATCLPLFWRRKLRKLNRLSARIAIGR